MFELIRVTAEYSNAVLVAVLPLFSNFATKAELPISRPITVNQIERFVCDAPTFDPVCAYMTLTNGLELWYHHGYVSGFRTPRSYFNLQDPKDIPRFYAALKLNKEEALQLARSSLEKLGYSLKETFTDQEPEVEMPPVIGTNVVPHYRFHWKDPVFNSRAVTIEVDTSRKMVQDLWLSSRFFWRDPPKIPIRPVPLHPKPPVSVTASNAYLKTLLPKISEYAKRLGLPVRLPVSRRDLERVELVDFDWVVMIKLKNGFWFDCEKDHVAGCTSPLSAYHPYPVDRPRPLEEYLGEWKLSENEAIEKARQAIRRLGYTLEEFHADRRPNITKHEQVGKYVVPRYFFRWLTNDKKTGVTLSLIQAEIDADKGDLKHLYLLNQPLPSGMPTPPIQIPQTNPPSKPSNPFE